MNTNRRNSTNSIFQFIGNIHNLSYNQSVLIGSSLIAKLFTSHFSQLALIFTWISGNLFHLSWSSNYSFWMSNPGRILPISHSVWDPNFGLYANDIFSVGYSEVTSAPSYSGIYNWFCTVGVRSEVDIYTFSFSFEVFAFIFMVLGYLHAIIEESTYFVSSNRSLIEIIYSSTGYRLNYHIGSLFGTTSVLWSLHIISVSIPVSRGIIPFNYSIHFAALFNCDWINFSTRQDGPTHIYGSFESSGTSVLTFIGGINSTTGALYLSDIAHHHLSLGILLLWVSHLYSSIYRALGHRLRDLSVSQGSGFYPIASFLQIRSLDLELSISLVAVSQASAYTAQHMYSLSPYVYLSLDYVSVLALYSHHIWISSFCLIGAMVHGSLFLIRDYHLVGTHFSGDLVYRILSHKACIVSHLSWVSLWLGFHTLLIYAHNDAVSAFGEPEKQLSIEPIYGQLIQEFSGKSIYGTTLIKQIGSAYYQGIESSFLPIGPSDLLAHHAIALGLHTTVLVLIKGALDSRGSKLISDKLQLGYSYPCDGPGRGGTCDISSWDSMYLAFFWIFNSVAWTLFYFQWKHLSLWQNNIASFNEIGAYLMAWFRDYLWFNSSPLIRGYSVIGSNDISVWAWTFLAAHLCWATGFMFLISWRGYWQELIDSILWSHTVTPIVSDIWNGSDYTPIALSIVQARFIGLVHFSVGFIVTYASFVIASAT